MTGLFERLIGVAVGTLAVASPRPRARFQPALDTQIALPPLADEALLTPASAAVTISAAFAPVSPPEHAGTTPADLRVGDGERSATASGSEDSRPPVPPAGRAPQAPAPAGEAPGPPAPPVASTLPPSGVAAPLSPALFGIAAADQRRTLGLPIAHSPPAELPARPLPAQRAPVVPLLPGVAAVEGPRHLRPTTGLSTGAASARTAAPAEPAIEVRINRVEVRPAEQAGRRRPGPVRAAPRQSLDDYLVRRRP